MQQKGRKLFCGFLALATCYLILTGVSVHLNKGANPEERKEEKAWIASSKHWVDRQMCNWMGVCGMWHLNSAGWTWDAVDDDIPPPRWHNASDFWTSGPEDPDSWTDEEWMRRKIPDYVFDHAPYVHLFSGEEFWPCDLGDHLSHTMPFLNYSEITDLRHQINLTNLRDLNDYEAGVHGKFMYMGSKENVEEWPSWLGGTKNIPNTPQIHRKEDEIVEWPGEDVEDSHASADQQQIFAVEEPHLNTNEVYWGLPTLTVSENGRCGGRSGFTCEGSKFGQCCSIYGWCGRGDAYCGDACDPLRGRCNDPFEIRPHPHAELRKRESNADDAAHTAPPAGRSSAPAMLIVVPKEDGIVDAFWFFFYSFNLGQTVLNIRFGNHVGDWEHTMIRFKDGKPIEVFLSEHNFGDAYAWHALEKYVHDPAGEGTMIGTWSNGSAAQIAKRPVVYSAVGSHAMYATPGVQPYILPWGMLHDQTDRGPLWDPALNAKSFLYDLDTKALRASSRNPTAPTGWFDYAGHWGDKYYELGDPRQYRLANQYHYVNGPSGPKFKNLARKHVCQGGRKCHIRNWANDYERARRMPPEEDVEEGGLPGGNATDDSGA